MILTIVFNVKHISTLEANNLDFASRNDSDLPVRHPPGLISLHCLLKRKLRPIATNYGHSQPGLGSITFESNRLNYNYFVPKM